MDNKVEAYLENKQSALTEAGEIEEISEGLGHNPRTGTRIGLSYLYLNAVSEAQKWFAVSSEEWVFKTQISSAHRISNNKDPHIGRFQWLDLLRAIQTAVLSASSRSMNESAKAAIAEVEHSDLQDLSGWQTQPRISAIAALSKLIVGDDPTEYLTELRSRLKNVDRPHDKTLYPIMDTIIDGLYRQDADAVEQSIKDLEDYQEEFIVGSDMNHFTEEAVNIDACAFIVLARRFGLDVRIQSDYVPSAVYNQEYYSLKNSRD